LTQNGGSLSRNEFDLSNLYLLKTQLQMSDPLSRAQAFAKSQRVQELISRAKEHDIIVEIVGTTTIVRLTTDNGESVSSTEWNFDTPDAEDFIYGVLQQKNAFFFGRVNSQITNISNQNK
jgi:hypothetical protein